jgi:uncharacterized protein (TIGR03790 family)
VPKDHIIGLNLPETESISRDDFESKLQQPLWNALKSRNLFVYPETISLSSTSRCSMAQARIRYAVLCYGVPVKIAPDPNRNEEEAEKLPPELRRNEAAVDSELALLPFLDRKLPLAGFLSNPFFLMTNRDLMTPTNGVLMVARVDGPSADIANGLVDKAEQAEKEGLWGRAYFDLRGITNGAYKLGDEWMTLAADAAKAYGYDVVMDKNSQTFPPSAPLNDIAFYFGWYDQSVSGPFTNRMAEFRPGAVAYHLHSFSSKTLRVPDVWWTGPLLTGGATATMGCTEEPYLQTTPQVNAFLARFLFLGFSFGEAAYAAQPSLSWQNTIIGDPLYRPFAKTRLERFQELSERKDKNLEWSILMSINVRVAQGVSMEEILKLYREAPEVKNSFVLQEKLGDLYHSRGKIFDAVAAYEAALKLPMSRLQRLRITLDAGPLLTDLGHPQEAYSLYQAVLKDFPDYTDKKEIYEHLAKAAARLNKSDEAREFERLAREQS